MISLCCLLLAACGGKGGGDADGGSGFTAEPDLCVTAQSVSGTPVVVSGSATYTARKITSTGLGGADGNKPIQGAEVHIYDSQGQRIQCGQTNSSGNFSLNISNQSGSYSVRIFSRADNANYKARVLNSPTGNQPYTIQTGFNLNGSGNPVSGLTLHAPHNGDLQGGAFNILDQVRLVNEKLRADTGGCVSCQSFTVAPSVPIFWSPGLSPAAYFNQPGSGVSFFLSQSSGSMQRGIYILGGIKGDVNCTDTDHFDNAIIIHEYAHYLENVYSASDSPGGSHNGNMIIDPRLAWSEGWANFFQAYIQGVGHYQDTVGNTDCPSGTRLGVSLNLTATAATANHQDRMPQNYAPYINSPYHFNYTIQSGEGIFREVSVSRLLHKIMRSSSPDDGLDLGFDEIWHIFSSSSALGSPFVKFRNAGLYNSLFRSYLDTNGYSEVASLDTAIADEYQVSNRTQYATPVTRTPGGTCNMNMSPVNRVGDGSDRYPHWQNSADLYEFEYNASSASTITLVNNGGEDLDLYLYRPAHVLLSSQGLVAASENYGAGNETINFSGQAYGKYLIVVLAYTNEKNPPYSTTNYYLTNGSGVRLCP